MEEIGRFNIITFKNQKYEFIVYEDYIYCKELTNFLIKKLYIKPNIELISEKGRFLLNDYNKKEKNYVKEYNISEELLKYMIENNLASISTEMAIYYGLNKDYGYDIKEKNNAFKWAKKKGLILQKQKEGIFN